MLKLFILMSLVISNIAIADTKLSLMGSVLLNSPDSDNINDNGTKYSIDEESKFGFGIGLRALMGINEQLYFRSGAGIVQKNFSYEINSPGIVGEYDQSFTYLNIPLTLYWKASPEVGFFGGTALYAKLVDDCENSGDAPSCSIQDEKTLVFPVIIGFDFAISEKVGIEVSYEYALTDTREDVKVHSAVASFLYHFDK